MAIFKPLAQASLLVLSVMLFVPGCIVEPRQGYEPREGYYDRNHHRWYHEHAWRECNEHEERCR